jgi:outer membrane biosynthesis protein TonB
VCTDEKGNVISLRLVGDHHHPEIDARVLDALMDWKYEPARLNGNPVPSCPWAVMVL